MTPLEQRARRCPWGCSCGIAAAASPLLGILRRRPALTICVRPFPPCPRRQDRQGHRGDADDGGAGGGAVPERADRGLHGGGCACLAGAGCASTCMRCSWCCRDRACKRVLGPEGAMATIKTSAAAACRSLATPPPQRSPRRADRSPACVPCRAWAAHGAGRRGARHLGCAACFIARRSCSRACLPASSPLLRCIALSWRCAVRFAPPCSPAAAAAQAPVSPT